MAFDRSKALKAAQKHLTKGHLDKAIVEYERLIAEDPGDARTLLKLGDLYTKLGDPKKACGVYRKVADQYAEQGFFLKAVAVFKQILKLDSKQLEAWEKLAEMYELLSLTSDALATYEKVADAYTQAGKTVRALDAMGKMAQLDRDNVAAAVKYAEALAKVHRKEEAAEAFSQGAAVLKRQGRMDDYVKVAERLLFHQPSNLEVARELAAVYLGRRDAKRALAKLQVCFKADPRDIDTLGLLASSFELLDQRQKAVSVYREMLRILADAGDPAGQVRVVKLLLALAPDDADARRLLAELGDPAPEGLTEESVPVIDLSDEELGDDDDIILVDDDDSGVMALGGGESQSGARNLPDNEPDGDLDEQLERMMNECEVFSRYKLHDKMEAQLKSILSLAPDHAQARIMLAEHYAETQMPRKAAAEFYRAAKTPGADPVQAQRLLARAAQLDPGNTAVTEALLDERPTSQVRHVEALDIPEYNQVDETSDDDLIIVDDDEAVEVATHAPEYGGDYESDVFLNSRPPPAAIEDSAAAPAGGIADAEDAFVIPESDAPPGADELEPFSEDLVIEESDMPPAMELPEPFTEDLVIEETELEPRVATLVGTGSPLPPSPSLDVTAVDEPELIFDEPLESDVGSDAERTFFSDIGGLASERESVAASSLAPEPVLSPFDVDDGAKFGGGEPELLVEEPSEEDARLIEEAQSEAVQHESLPPVGGSLPPEVAETLEEVDFYVQQGLSEEAIESLQDALESNPEHPALVARLAELRGDSEAAASGAPLAIEDAPATVTVPAFEAPMALDEPEPEDHSFALAESLASEGGAPPTSSAPSAGGEVAVSEVIQQFRAGVEKAVDRGDAATHYDLGIAYVEMGLHQEAISEFKLCLEGEGRRCQAHTMIGLSYLAEGSMGQAIVHFKQALGCEPSNAERLELWFELGNAHELLGQRSEALGYYENVKDIDPTFRDVTTCIERLTEAATEQDEDDEFDSMFDNMILKD